MKNVKNKEDINIFGEKSIAYVEKLVGGIYAIIRNDGFVIATPEESEIKEYYENRCPIRTMYTGSKYGTGDFILVADTIDGPKEIHRWK